MAILLGRAWVSPTLAWLHCTRVCVCLFACLLACLDRTLTVNHFRLLLCVVGHWTPDYSAMEATGSCYSACNRRWLECCHLSMPSPRPAACAGPACVQHACIIIISRPDSQFLCTRSLGTRPSENQKEGLGDGLRWKCTERNVWNL